MSFAAGFLALILIAPALVLIGVILLLTARRAGPGHPACGGCGYDVSRSVSQERCPECGAIFAKVGIVPPQGRGTGPYRLGAAIAMIALGVLIALVPVALAIHRPRARTIIVQPTPGLPPPPRRPQPTGQPRLSPPPLPGGEAPPPPDPDTSTPAARDASGAAGTGPPPPGS
jgi:hypothetical protein